MQSLRATNFLLAVIAICMVFQLARDSSPPATAAVTKPSVQAVKIVGTPNVNISGIYGNSWTKEAPGYAKGTIPVTVWNPLLPVSGSVDVSGNVEVSGDVEVSSIATPVDIEINDAVKVSEIEEPVKVTNQGYGYPPLKVRVDDTYAVPVKVRNY